MQIWWVAVVIVRIIYYLNHYENVYSHHRMRILSLIIDQKNIAHQDTVFKLWKLTAEINSCFSLFLAKILTNKTLGIWVNGKFICFTIFILRPNISNLIEIVQLIQTNWELLCTSERSSSRVTFHCRDLKKKVCDNGSKN